MKRSLYWIHRWTGVVLALFMLTWFASGVVIMYSENLNQNRPQQLAHAEKLLPASGWLSLGEAWERSAEERKTAVAEILAGRGEAQRGAGEARAGGRSAVAPDVIVDARLVRSAGQPYWLVENGPGRRFAISAVDGKLHRVSVEDALRIASQWVNGEDFGRTPVAYVDTIDTDSTLGNQEALKPFHRIAVDDGNGTELLISARTGEVYRASTSFERGLYYTGNWIHLLKFLDVLSPGETRHNVQSWVGFGATAACLTGIIIGWLRWRPGWFGKPTYSQGRTQPYRDFWWKWHFWGGLIGGVFALGWGLSGYLSTNPWLIFSNGNPTRAELAGFVGSELPAVMKDWKPAPLTGEDADGIVELGWRRLAGEAVLLAYTPDGRRQPQAIEGAATRFSDAAVLDAARRLVGKEAEASYVAQGEYDSYYYPRRGRGTWERQLPVSRVDFADASGSRLYIDPIEGRVLIKQDQSRRVYRWAFNLLHYWDFGWLQKRPVWDVWMLTWIALGLTLSATAVWLAWQRLKVTFKAKKRARQEAKIPAVAARPATESAVAG
ncbi:PepSY domain-containing protein [Methylococcus sp. EFPC2]|uniref:PepSY domain-containing protein n=1 Tax=Methylococcus sp. EFPC2 TaxID=2812648 RepID=UPI001967BF8E|nr:PepSY domain-containing protein [Methylococcus sp. EFPC2]QSA96505.1 PepSY domain-containing protein [Methylococcus sp. EFPC2]